MIAFQGPGAPGIGFCEIPCIPYLKLLLNQAILGGFLFQTHSLTPTHPQADRPDCDAQRQMRTKRDVREEPTNEKENHGFQGLTLSSESRRETDEAGRQEGRHGGGQDRTGVGG